MRCNYKGTKKEKNFIVQWEDNKEIIALVFRRKWALLTDATVNSEVWNAFFLLLFLKGLCMIKWITSPSAWILSSLKKSWSIFNVVKPADEVYLLVFTKGQKGDPSLWDSWKVMKNCKVVGWLFLKEERGGTGEWQTSKFRLYFW